MLNIRVKRARYQVLKAEYGPSDISPTVKKWPIMVGNGYRYWNPGVP